MVPRPNGSGRETVPENPMPKWNSLFRIIYVGYAARHIHAIDREHASSYQRFKIVPTPVR